MAGVAENTNTKTNQVRITAQTTTGFEENVRLLGRGETELALFDGIQAYQGLRGIGPYKGELPYKDIRGIAVAYAGNISWNARQDINKVTDLARKKVSLGPPGSLVGYLGGLSEISLPGIIYTRNRSSNDDPPNRYSSVCFLI